MKYRTNTLQGASQQGCWVLFMTTITALTVPNSHVVMAHTSYARRFSNERRQRCHGRGGSHRRDHRGNSLHTGGLLPNDERRNERLKDSESHVLRVGNIQRFKTASAMRPLRTVPEAGFLNNGFVVAPVRRKPHYV